MRNPYDYYITPEEYEIAKQNGVSARTLEYRVRSYGWPKHRAVTEPPRKIKYRLPDHFVELAKRNGIAYDTLRWRVRRGWDLERAATQPLIDRRAAGIKLGKARRKYPIEIVELAKRNGISYQTFHQRVGRRKWDLMRAATTPVMSRREIGSLAVDKPIDWGS